ncbi:hypothetical protein AYL99_10709 [Fonsecaea erecta]|uniref:Nucleolar protein Dnt1-like N-terminal domain-containing protein n=1 Tax=Fonsecaea erecta TaxID=1367422 RepID=A0A178Z5H4_9EURO|nr:hypothetical protein AYL99_10709 [Fonsecaea erecta]OAP55009.1 hypothetical protein AYL99_10709 [Fonsecaea erecta]
MVKLRVAARILSEDAYLQSLQGSANLPVKGEKRLVVVVREPYKWQIGTLALEVQRAYKSCYQVELPTIKYLKDNEDDCDLDPRAYVSDLLLDEGKARTDASDQRVTIKVILEQGRGLREGSVAIGSQLDHPVYHIQLEESSRPPVPTFPALPSSLGKRAFPASDEPASTATASKRPRQVEIPYTQEEHPTPISSIEHEDVQGSLELVEGTQFTNPDQDLGGRQKLLQPKQESPELRRLLQNVTPAILDELEELAERPPIFGSKKRQRNGLTRPRDSRESNGLLPSIDPVGRLQKRSQGPITPPSETSRRLSGSTSRQIRRSEEAANSTAQPATASASKFKRRDIYAYPESEIDDSQMSPRSRQAQLSNRGSKGRLTHIESLQSPREHEEGDTGFSISQAIDALDVESILGDSHSMIPSASAPEPVSGNMNIGSPVDFENSIYEDAETGDAQPSSVTDPNMYKETEGNGAADPEQMDGEDKENGPLAATSTPSRKDVAKTTHAKDATSGTQGDGSSAKSKGLSKDLQAHESRPAAKRVRKRKSDAFNADGSQLGPNQRAEHSAKVEADKPAKKAPKTSQRVKKSQGTPTLDSPGEQLSQNLRESTASQPPLDIANKRVAGAQQKTALATPAKKSKVHKPGKDSEGPGSVLSRSTTSKKDATSTTPSERVQNKRSQEKPAVATARPGIVATDSSPTTILRASQPDYGSANLPMKTLPNWGSEIATADNPMPSISVTVDRERNDKQADLEGNSFAHPGLTPEEIKIMESRKGMTKEQYEAEKRRRQLEAKKNAEGQRKQEAAAKKKPNTDKSSADRNADPRSSDTPEPKRTVALTKSKTPKRPSTGDNSPAVAHTTTGTDTTTREEPKHGTKQPGSGKADSARRDSSSTNFSKVQIAESKVAPKTPAKTPAKSPSVKSSAVGKTPKQSGPPQSTEKTTSSVTRRSTPAPSAKTDSKVGKTPAKTPQPRKPTLETVKRLVDLREVVRSANQANKAAPNSVLSHVNAAKQKQGPSVFNVDDDEDDEESDESEDDDEEEEVKVVAGTRKTGPDDSKKKIADDEPSTSSASSEEVGKKATSGNRTSHTKGLLLGRPGARKRHESEDDDDDDNSDSREDSGEDDEL